MDPAATIPPDPAASPASDPAASPPKVRPSVEAVLVSCSSVSASCFVINRAEVFGINN